MRRAVSACLRWRRSSSRASSAARRAAACRPSTAASAHSVTVRRSRAAQRATAAQARIAPASPGSPGWCPGSGQARRSALSPAAWAIRWAVPSTFSSPARTLASAARRRSASSASTAAKRRVSKSRPSSRPRAASSARRKRANSPCGNSTTWQNCSRLMPSSCSISSPISWWERLRASQRSPSYSRSQLCALSLVVPVPRFLGRSCSGRRVISRRRPPAVSSRVTSVGVAASAWSLRRLVPGAWRGPGTDPYRA